MKLNIDNYLDEIFSDVEEIIQKGGNIILKAPTGSGKTQMLLRYLKKHTEKKILYLCPTVSLVRNIEENSSDVPVGRGYDFISKHKGSTIITTYDSIQFLPNYDMVIIDEAHLLAGHASFRGIIDKLVSYNAQKVLVSATPVFIDKMRGYNLVEVTAHNQRPINIEYAVTQHEPTLLIPAIVKDFKRDRTKLLLIRCNNKETLQNIYESYRDTYKIAIFYSGVANDGFQDNALSAVIEKGIVPSEIDILLCTSIFDAGLSLRVHRNVDARAVSNQTDYESMPNVIDMIQLSARVRSNSLYQMDLKLYGDFGDVDIDDIDNIKPAKNTSIMVKQFGQHYDWFAHLHMESYLFVLDEYKIRANEIKVPQYDYGNIKVSYQRGRLDIVKSFHSFSNEFDEVHLACEKSDKLSWLEVLREEDKLVDDLISIGIVKNHLLTAIKYNIHFNMFIGKRYEDKRLKLLKDAVNEYHSHRAFTEMVNELLKGVSLDVGEKHKIAKSKYDLLISRHQEIIRAIANLIYKNGVNWNDSKRTTVTLKRVMYTDYVDSYLQGFNSESKLKIAS